MKSYWAVETYMADVSDDVRIYTRDVVGVALRRDEDLVLLVDSTGAGTIYAPIQFTDENLVPRRAVCRVYNSERRSWEDRGALKRTELRAMAFSIERGGFRLLEIRRRVTPPTHRELTRRFRAPKRLTV